ncbi:hypothetical protein CPAV1605_644 [seawater metagenome]|uniref:Mitochondrial resolvase Ydc2 catalytic domain-containing protein n=1 Tax=seawater metagenome TaxID=1561972 RepID=A0A5E8CJV4_9ZZZZ
MKILSWDVGIIHLAYCILEYDENNKKFKIYDWKQINLTNYNEDDYKCMIEIKNKGVCGCNGKYFYTNENDEKVYLCGKHKSKYDPEFEELEKYFVNRKEEKIKNKCCYEKDGKECSRNGYYYKDDKCFCTVHAKCIVKKLNNNKKLQSIKKVNSMKVSIDELRLNLVTKLDELSQLLKVEKVLIENQPSLKNPKMKAISSTIYDYFLIRGIVDKKNNSTITSVKYISPSNKLKVDADNTIKTLSKTADNKKYKLTKQLGIQYCKQLIQHDQVNLDFLATQKKKDDLCDAFLQGAYYLTK